MENIVFILNNQDPYLGRYERSLILRNNIGETYYEPFYRETRSFNSFPIEDFLPKGAILEIYNV